MSGGPDLARAFLDAVAEDGDTPNVAPPSSDRPIRLAVVDPAYTGVGNPKVTFEGEATMTVKAYPYLEAPPVAGSRVALAPVGRGYVILGASGLTGAYAQLAARTAALENTAWAPVIPTGVASTGSIATYSGTTGEVTLPAGGTLVRLDGVFSVGYETLIRIREADSWTAFTNIQQLRFTAAGVALTTAAYNFAGRWSQYDGTSGIFAVNGLNIQQIGYGATAGGRVERELEVISAADAAHTLLRRVWSYSVDAAREMVGSGAYNNNAVADGFQLITPNGSFAASIRCYRRKVMI